MTSVVVSVPHSKIAPINPKTGEFVREWYLCFQNLYTSVGGTTGGGTSQVLHGGGAYDLVNLSSEVTGILLGVQGGTGVANTGKTLTMGGNVKFSGSGPTIITVTGSTNITIPTTGTLAALSDIGTLGFQSSSNVNISGGTVSNVVVNAISLFTGGSLSINNQTSTGGQTATFIAANKPGGGTTSPDKWLTVTLDGVAHYIPCFL